MTQLPSYKIIQEDTQQLALQILSLVCEKGQSTRKIILYQNYFLNHHGLYTLYLAGTDIQIFFFFPFAISINDRIQQ